MLRFQAFAGDGIFNVANDGIAGFCNNVAALRQEVECKRGIRKFFRTYQQKSGPNSWLYGT